MSVQNAQTILFCYITKAVHFSIVIFTVLVNSYFKLWIFLNLPPQVFFKLSLIFADKHKS